MATSKYVSKCHITLPKEMWHHVWTFLDFDTLQKTCTIVSKKWLEEIRDSPRLSGEMTLVPGIDFRSNQDIKRINSTLSRWKKLRVLHIPNGVISFGMNLKKHKLLRKIYVSGAKLSFKKLGDWGKATKYWFDPKHFWNPAKLENVIDLKVRMDETLPKGLAQIERIGKSLNHVENIRVAGEKFKPELFLSLNLKSLKTLSLRTTVDVNDLLGTLHTIENVKGLDLDIYIGVDSGYQAFLETMKNVFKEALEIIDKKFPRNSTKFIINDLEWENYIKKCRGKAPRLYSCSEPFDEPDHDTSYDSDEWDW